MDVDLDSPARELLAGAVGARDDELQAREAAVSGTGRVPPHLCEETLHRLEGLDADDPAFDEELATLMREIRHHIKDEEGETFAHMREHIEPDELRRLGDLVQAFKKVAPTRPHPHVPNDPLARTAAGPAASLFDRLRDLASGRGRD